ncbi:CaiB/BaiF CoA transferase family protein [Oceaniradius stylonematis]|uniref:CaiB/BaiF CoA transferase family protein n=1 Tax=Oceaniradius stylonematis TaxID=2184161 RepID=UPI00273DD5D8|nr:CaiB/BaiF CoA-transferase family protein [Oceaniradius stylonematis]
MNRPSASAGGSVGLQGVRVLDLSRLAPGPYCTMLLADMGAEVIVVGGGVGSLPIPVFLRGKKLISLDLKCDEGRRAFRRLAEDSDVVVEGYRPGVAARLGIDYDTLKAINPRLIYCSLTGYGQTGPLSQEAGHDINYAALSGALGAFGPVDNVPAFPLNLLADFAGGSLFATNGILCALYERERTGMGQYIDAAMVDGCLSLMAMHFADWGKPVLAARGDGLVAGTAPYYRCYLCADGKFVATGALERRFFENLWAGLGYDDPPPPHLDRSTWAAMTMRFKETFGLRTRDDWVAHFAGKDACVAPVLDPDEALAHSQNRGRHPAFGKDDAVKAPIMRATSGHTPDWDMTDRTEEMLSAAGLCLEEIEKAKAPAGNISGLAWPPL